MKRNIHNSKITYSIARMLVVAFVVLSGLDSAGQKIDIDWLQISGNDIVVHYSLEDTNPLHAYTVNLFSSRDNFSAPLVKLSGDHGNEVKAGKDRQIAWHITQELGQFAGPIELEIRAKMYVPFMKMTDFQSSGKYKRGKNYPLVWKSGNPGGQVDIELYNGDTRVHSDRNVPNSGKFDWQVPEGAKPGSGYRLKFTNVKSREETFLTEPFRIANKIPRAAIIAGGALLGVGIFILTRSQKNPTAETPEDSELPSWEDIPSN